MQRQRRKRELKMKNSRWVAVLHEARTSKTLFFPTYNAEMNFIDFICSIFQFLLMPCRDASLPQTLSPRRLPGGRPFHFALPSRRCFSLCFSFFFSVVVCVALSRILILMLVIVGASTEVFSLYLYTLLKEGILG